LIYLADFLPKEAENLPPEIGHPFDDPFDLPLNGKDHSMDSKKKLENPTEGWSISGLSNRVGKGLSLVFQLFSHPSLGH
jgi:hypothetical protein